MMFLQNSVIDEDEFLRYRISERFNGIMKSLFDAHKKDGLPPEQSEIINDMKQLLQIYLAEKKKGASDSKAKFVVLCKQMELNASMLTDEESRVLIKVLENAPVVKRGVRKNGK